jgi:hypothetical protein
MFGYAAPVLPQQKPAGAPPPPTQTPQAFPPPVAAPPPQSFAPPHAPPPQQFSPPPAAPPPQSFAPPQQKFSPPPAAPPPQQFVPPPAFVPPPTFSPPAQPAFTPPPTAPAPQPWSPPPSAPPLAAPPPTGQHLVSDVTNSSSPGSSGSSASGFGLADQANAEVRQGRLFGVPFSLLRDQQFEMKVLMVAAIALVVTRFIPIMKFAAFSESKMIWAWTPDGSGFFKLMIWPFLAAAVYGAVVFTPPEVKKNIPPVVFRWAPFVIAFISTGLLYATMPLGAFVGLFGGEAPTGFAMMAWFYPVLVFGLVVKLQNPEDKIAPVLIAVGGFLAFLGGMIEVKDFFHFKGAGFFGAVHNILWFVMILASLGAVAFALDKVVPALAVVRPFLSLATAVFVAWPLVAVVLTAFLVWHQSSFANFLLMLIHMLTVLLSFYVVLLLTAPEALDALKGLLGQPIGVPATSGGGAAMASAPQMVPPHIHQQLIDLDAAWSRGGMTPEEYHSRRNAILAQAR